MSTLSLDGFATDITKNSYSISHLGDYKMSSGTGFFDTYFNDPRGKSVTISSIITALTLGISGVIAVTDPVSESFQAKLFSFMYQDNDWSRGYLVVAEFLLFMISFVYLSIALGNRKELNGDLPDWLDVIIPGVVIMLLSALISNLTFVGTQTGLDSNVTGLSNFTSNMRLTLLLLNFVGIILITVYFFFVSKEDQE